MVEIIELKDAPNRPSNKTRAEGQAIIEKAHDRVTEQNKNSRLHERQIKTFFAISGLKPNTWQQWLTSETDLDYSTWLEHNNINKKTEV